MRGVNTAVDTAAGDDANIGWTAGEGLILTGQGSTNDVTIKNDADARAAKVRLSSPAVDKFKFDYAVDDGASPADAYAKLKTLDLFSSATDV